MATPATIVNDSLPTVALVGRVNVGKSSLFNRIIENRQAIVSDIPGTTRTRNIAVASWRGKQFRLVDTGGLTFSEDVPLEEEIIHQTEIALNEADIIIFVTYIQAGILPQEKELARRLLKNAKTKPMILVANKADNKSFYAQVHDREWMQLGFGEPMPVSAANGSNVGDFLDLVYKKLGKVAKRPKVNKELNPIKVAIMGRPNVGKSSLFNQLIGEERVIVSDLPHTTREPHDLQVTFDDEVSKKKIPLLFIDTAGIRRKQKVSGELEKIGIGKSIATISKSDIVLLVLDASEAITDQDQQLAGLLREHTRSVIIVINKWDTADDNDDAFRNEVKARIYKSFPHLDFAPIVFTSAKTGYRVHQIFPLIKQAWDARQIVVEDEVADAFLKRITKRKLPTRGKGTRHPKIYAFRQLGFNPPMFEIIIKPNTSLHMSYVHYIENRLREEFGFFAAPIIMKLSKFKK